MKIGAGFCLVFWMFSICICMTVTYNNVDNELLLTDDIDKGLDAGHWMDKSSVDDKLGSAARERLHKTLSKPSSVDIQTPRNFRAIVKALDTSTDKLDFRTLFPDKRAYMHDASETILELLIANADTLSTLTGDVKMLKSNVDTRLENLTDDIKMMKANVNTSLENLTDDVKMIKTNAETRLDTLTGDVKTIKFELKTKLDEFKTIFDMQEVNTEKLDNLAKYVARHIHLPYSSCLEYLDAGLTRSGKYQIYISHTMKRLTVYCDQETDGGGWLVFQRRKDGSVDFYRDWKDYKAGFGETTGEFWLGNDHLHAITQDQQELRVDLVAFDGASTYAKYSTFAIGSESKKYTLTVSSGTAPDSLAYQNRTSFSTKDRDNDIKYGRSCAQRFKGSWWYNACSYSNLNGIYYDNAKSDQTGIVWYHWKNQPESLKKTEMKIRPKQ